MKQKAQVGLFLFLILIIVSIAIIATQVKHSRTPALEQTLSVPIDGTVAHFVENCLADIGGGAIYDIALRGGYYHVPQPSMQFYGADTPIYWNRDTSLKPSRGTIAQEIASFVNANLNYCLNNFSALEEQGYSIEMPIDFHTLVTVSDENVVITLLDPLAIKRENTEQTIQGLSATIDTPFGSLYSIVSQFMEEQSKNPSDIPLGYLASMASKYGFNFEIIQMSDELVIINLMLDWKDDTLTYSFAQEYSAQNHQVSFLGVLP